MTRKVLDNEHSSDIQHTQKLIIQVGRLDRSYRDKIKFYFEGKQGEADLTSSFLVELDFFKGAKRLIVFPISIILQDNLLALNDPFIERIKTTDIEEYFKSPETLLNYHPQVEGRL